MNGVGQTASYQYDADGLRTSKAVNGETTQYYYVGNHLTYEKRDSKELYNSYDGDGLLTGIRYVQNGDAADYVVVTNFRGDVTSLYTSAGTEVARYSYDGWGKVTSIQTPAGQNITDDNHIANVNPMRYRGYYQDTETGMYYLKARYYDAETHRFLNADTLVGANGDFASTNLFNYCGNNPINRNVETGNSWKSAWGWVTKKATQAKNAVVNTYKKCEAWVKVVVSGGAVAAGDSAANSAISKMKSTTYKRNYSELQIKASPGRTINSTPYIRQVSKGTKALKGLSKTAGVISAVLAVKDIAVDAFTYEGQDMYKAMAMDVGLFALGMAFGAAATFFTGGAALAVFAIGFTATTALGTVVDSEKNKLHKRS